MLDLESLVDLEEREAIALIKSAELKVRVLERNGKIFAETRDCKLNRVNLYIAYDKVYKATVG